jgi:hypothetical protein
LYRREIQNAAAAIATHAIGKAFGFLAGAPRCSGLGCEDVMPLFAEAFRRKLSKSGY